MCCLRHIVQAFLGVRLSTSHAVTLAEYSGNLFFEMPFAPWSGDRRSQEGRYPTDFCPTGPHGMSGAAGVAKNRLPEYSHSLTVLQILHFPTTLIENPIPIRQNPNTDIIRSPQKYCKKYHKANSHRRREKPL